MTGEMYVTHNPPDLLDNCPWDAGPGGLVKPDPAPVRHSEAGKAAFPPITATLLGALGTARIAHSERQPSACN